MARRLIISPSDPSKLARARVRAGFSPAENSGKAYDPANDLSPASFSRLKAKLKSGQDATLIVFGDSTSVQSIYTPFYKLGAFVGQAHGCNARVFAWNEATKVYSAPLSVNTGVGPTLTIYLASISGTYTWNMWMDARKPTAIDAIPTPDAIIWHHGHNALSSPTNFASVGGYLGPMGLAGYKWPNVPQIVTTQNPLRDNDNYAPNYAVISQARDMYPGLGYIDTYADFIAAGKAAGLYDDNIHPSDTLANSAGAALTASRLFAAYTAAGPGDVPTAPWAKASGGDILVNGDFSDWTGAAPAGWTLSGALATKETTLKFSSQFAWSVALNPNGLATPYMRKMLTSDEVNAIKGKTVSVSILAYRYSPQLSNPNLIFGYKPPGAGATIIGLSTSLSQAQDGWMIYGVHGVPVATDMTTGQAYIDIYAVYAGAPPANNNPFYIQKVSISEGYLPKFGLT